MTKTVQGAASRAELLALMGAYVSADRMTAIATALGEIPDRPFHAPPKIVALLFASRAGSSYAGRLLANTCHFREVGENFAPD